MQGFSFIKLVEILIKQRNSIRCFVAGRYEFQFSTLIYDYSLAPPITLNKRIAVGGVIYMYRQFTTTTVK